MTRLPQTVRNHGARRSGVTLIELLIVILIMLMITAVTVPAISPALEGRKVREAARIVEVFLNGARNRAIASGHPVGVLIEPDENEPSQCIALSYVEQPDPYAGDYEHSALAVLGNGGFGAWQTLPVTGLLTTGVVANDLPLRQGDVGWVQNIAPGDTFILGTDDTILYRLFLGEPYIDINGNGRFDAGEPFNDVDGSGAATNGVPAGSGYTPPNSSLIDPITGFFNSIPQPVTWGISPAQATAGQPGGAYWSYTYADPVVAVNYMSPFGFAFDKVTSNYDQVFFLDFNHRRVNSPSRHASLDPTNSGAVSPTFQFQFLRRPVKTSSAVVNLPDSTCIDLGSNYVFPPGSNTPGNLVAVPGSGLDMLVPFSSGSSTLGNYATFRPNPLTDHEIVPTASATTVVNRPLMITFDSSGIVDKVYSWDERSFIKDTQPASLSSPINFTNYQGRLATSPIYLLIGKRELIDGAPELIDTIKNGVAPLKPIFNMQDPASLWVAINPRTGLISSAENVAPDLTQAPPTTQTLAQPQLQLYFNVQAYQARTLAREALDMGGM